MNPNSPHRLLSFSPIIYGLLLKAYPRAHREAYGPAMLQLFRDQCRDAWQESRHWGLLKLWCHIVPDLARTSLVEQWDHFRHRPAIPPKIPTTTRSHRPTAIFVSVSVSVFVLVVTLAVIETFLLPKTYASTARVGVNWNQTKSIGPSTIQSAIEVMQSQVVLDQTIQQLDLCQKWGQKFNNGTDLPLDQARLMLTSQLLVRPVPHTQLIEITVYSNDPREASNIANSLARTAQNVTQKMSQLSIGSSSDINLTKASPPLTLLIVDSAVPAPFPIKPNKALNIFLGIVFGGFFGLILGLISGGLAAYFPQLFRKSPPHLIKLSTLL